MKRILLLGLILPSLVTAAVVYQTTDQGVILSQGSSELSTHANEQECIDAAKNVVVNATTVFECSKRTLITATYTSEPPPDSDGDGVSDDADQCVNDPGPAPTGCPPVQVASKYVSTGGGLTACTSVDPCSLQHAADTSVAGDVILVAAGTYAVTVPVTSTTSAILNIKRSGTASSPIEYRAEGEVILTNPNGYGIYLKRVSFVTLQGFNIQACKLKCVASREATATLPVRGLTIRGLTITNGRQEGMYLSQVADSLIEGNSITQVGLDLVETTGHGIYLANAGSDGTTIRKNVIMIGASRGAAIHINGDEGQGGDGVISSLVIDSNVLEGGIKGVSGDGLQNSLIVNNLIYNSRQHAIRGYKYDAAAGPTGLVIVNNTARATTAQYGSAIKLSDERGPSTIFNNILFSTDRNYWTGTASNNWQGRPSQGAWPVDASYKPLAAVKDLGIAELAGIAAPVMDIEGTVRDAPLSIGAYE